MSTVAGCLAGGLLVLAVCAVSVAREAARHASLASSDAGAALVVLACSVVLVPTLGWLAMTLIVCLLEALRAQHHVRPACGTGSLLRPRAVRLLLATALGVGMAAPATATAGSGDTPPGGPAGAGDPTVLAGLPLPDRPVTSRPSAAGPRSGHRVRQGECLWTIAADHLPRSAPTRAVAAATQLLYRRNADTVGPDPDLILPGMVLTVPPLKEAP